MTIWCLNRKCGEPITFNRVIPAVCPHCGSSKMTSDRAKRVHTPAGLVRHIPQAAPAVDPAMEYVLNRNDYRLLKRLHITAD